MAVKRIIRASPLLHHSVSITTNRITFRSTQATITALATEYASAAGANPTITVFDELWGYTSERSRRLWDEMVPVPTRKPSVRFTVTYAGFVGESDLLEGLYKRAMASEEIAPALHRAPGLLAYWSHEALAPWQSAEWIAQMSSALRRNQFLRMIENRWVSADSVFVESEAWDACVDPNLAPLHWDRSLEVWGGIDASVRRDSSAIVLCACDEDAKRVRLIWHRVFQPTSTAPIDFEAQIEATLLDLSARFRIREMHYDPYQMVASAQRLARAGVKMVEFPQTIGNLTAASSNLYELIMSKSFVTYPDAALRKSVLQTVASESARGWKLSKERQSHKIDVVVALAQAALGAAKQSGADDYYEVTALDGSPLIDEVEFNGLPPLDIGYTDIEGRLLPEVAARKAERLERQVQTMIRG